MSKERIERGRDLTIAAHQADTIYLWDSPIHGTDRPNLSLCGSHDGTEITVYSLTQKQLGDLYLDIARYLGKAPEPTVVHLREIHNLIGRMLSEPPPPATPFEPDSSGSA